MNPRSLALGILLPVSLAMAQLSPLDIGLAKGPTCVIQDSALGSETFLAPSFTRVNLQVTDGYAQATVRQAFVNPLATRTEVAYVFPLPEKGAVHAMSFQSQGRLYRARIEEKNAAQAAYDSARAAGAQAGLLLQERPNLFQQKLANLAAHDTVWVEIQVVLPLKYADGWWELAFPTMVGGRYQSAGASEPSGTVTGWNPPATREGPAFQFNVLVQSSAALDSLVSPTHPVEVHDLASSRDELTGRQLIDSLSIPEARFGKALWLVQQPTYPNGDFVLRLHRASQALDAGMLSCRPAGSDTGYFRVSLFPELQGPTGETPLDVVLLVDRSGSQSGFPLQHEKAVASRILHRLGPNDNLTVLAFSDDVEYALGTDPVAATAANVAQALRFVQGIEVLGGTQLLAAIQASLAVPPTSGHQRVYVFLTDGFITDEAAILEALQRKQPSPQVFTFGCGNSLNRYFLESAAKVGSGFAVEITGSMDPDSAADVAWNRIASPQVSGIQAVLQGVTTFDGIGSSGSMLYKGLPWTLAGRYVGKGDATLLLQGTYAGKPWTLSRTVAFSGSCPVDRTTPLVWARETIDSLEVSEGTRSVNQARIVELSRRYQVLSKYTAFLALDGIPLSEAEQDISSGMATEIAPKDATLAGSRALRTSRAGGRLTLEWVGKGAPLAWTLSDLRGRVVARWGALPRVEWDGKDLRGRLLPAGTYLMRVGTAQGQRTVPVQWMP